MFTVSAKTGVILCVCLAPSMTRAPSLDRSGSFSRSRSKMCRKFVNFQDYQLIKTHRLGLTDYSDSLRKNAHVKLVFGQWLSFGFTTSLQYLKVHLNLNICSQLEPAIPLSRVLENIFTLQYLSNYSFKMNQNWLIRPGQD